jgi:hypothetical protein
MYAVGVAKELPSDAGGMRMSIHPSSYVFFVGRLNGARVGTLVAILAIPRMDDIYFRDVMADNDPVSMAQGVYRILQGLFELIMEHVSQCWGEAGYGAIVSGGCYTRRMERRNVRPRRATKDRQGRVRKMKRAVVQELYIREISRPLSNEVISFVHRSLGMVVLVVSRYQ